MIVIMRLNVEGLVKHVDFISLGLPAVHSYLSVKILKGFQLFI